MSEDGALAVRDMAPQEGALRIDYFHDSPDEFLVLLGIDRKLLPDRASWHRRFAAELAEPVGRRTTHGLVWTRDGVPIGFSTADRIVSGDGAFMHLHLFSPTERGVGLGTVLVRLSAARYLAQFDLKRLFSEPNACNVAPNRCLQRAGFRYCSSQAGVPGPFHFPQVTTRWRIERGQFSEADLALGGLDAPR